jgi:hypothetical protein
LVMPRPCRPSAGVQACNRPSLLHQPCPWHGRGSYACPICTPACAACRPSPLLPRAPMLCPGWPRLIEPHPGCPPFANWPRQVGLNLKERQPQHRHGRRIPLRRQNAGAAGGRLVEGPDSVRRPGAVATPNARPVPRCWEGGPHPRPQPPNSTSGWAGGITSRARHGGRWPAPRRPPARLGPPAPPPAVWLRSVRGHPRVPAHQQHTGYKQGDDVVVRGGSGVTRRGSCG